MMQTKLMVTNFTIICRETRDKETVANLMRAPKLQVIMEILNSNKKKFHVLLESCLHCRRQYDETIDGYLLTSSINHKYIIKVRSFATAKTNDMYDHMKPTQRNFQSNVSISHVGTNELTTDMTPEGISEKLIT